MKWDDSGFFYIGKSSDLRIRKLSHLHEMRSGTHANKVQTAYDNLGFPTFEVLEYTDIEHLDELEDKYISLHKDNKFLLNSLIPHSEDYVNDPNPIIEVYRGRNIRKSNIINIRIDEITYKQLIDAEIETGLSQRKILAYSGMPCKSCEGTFVTVFTDNGEVKIKRGIFSKRIPNTNGVNKIKKANGKINSHSEVNK